MIPKTVTSIGTNAIPSTCTIHVYRPSAGNDTFYYVVNDDGCVEIIGCKTTSTELTVPTEIEGKVVNKIGDYGFFECTTINSITIPSNIKSIGKYAFNKCTGLINATIPTTVDSVGDYAFYYCTGLVNVTISEGVKSIGEGAFYNCTSLVEAVVPDTAVKVGSHAFYNCTSMTTATIGISTDAIGDYTFYNSKTEQVAKTPEHSYGSWTKVDAEIHQRTCACDDVETDNHNWDSGVITTQPTHTIFGVRTYTCGDCSATKTEQVAKTTDHTHGFWTKVDDETHKRICACGDVETEDHSWDDGTVTVQPTQTTLGECVYICQGCGTTLVETIPMLPEYYVGDANGDGVVDTLDRMILSRYLANWDEYTVDTVNIAAVDLNKDGVVDTLDRMILNRHLANWEGYEDVLNVAS